MTKNYFKDKSSELIAQLKSVSPKNNEKGYIVLKEVFTWLLEMANSLYDCDYSRWDSFREGVMNTKNNHIDSLNSKTIKSRLTDAYRLGYEQTLDDLITINEWSKGDLNTPTVIGGA
ncbi:MAG: hypothetical protein EAZ15_05090 [Sphingobacteriales bacterium]|nr:MAG: hypothetical protein EAZ15_05090 [Sphingobacteriales bacterium]